MQLTDNTNNPTLLRNGLQARSYDTMKFAEKLRALRRARQISQRALAMTVGVDHTYLSKIENAKLTFGDYPSEELICKLAEALDADPNELLLLAEKIPYEGWEDVAAPRTEARTSASPKRNDSKVNRRP